MDDMTNQTFVIRTAAGNVMEINNQQQNFIILNRGAGQKNKQGEDIPTYTVIK